MPKKPAAHEGVAGAGLEPRTDGLVSVRDISATGEGRSPKPSLGLAARQHRNRAAILRPAGDVVAGRDGPLLAIADGANSCRRNAAGHEIVLGGFGPPRAQREIIFARATLVGMALDGQIVAAVLLQPAH